jgi:hypothetical protein
MDTFRLRQFLKYFAKQARQPPGEWEGFYLTPAEGMNFGLRFQLAFPVYAMYAIARAEPLLADEATTVISRYIEKMLHPRVWAYWFQGALAHQSRQSRPLVATTLEKVHTGGASVPLDPCAQGNVQYSGHLASMLGFYRLLSGDERYNREGFVLQAEADGQVYSFEYTYTRLVEQLERQMRENYFGGLCCEPGRAYAACNNHACIANVLHDRVYGTNFGETNTRWAEWVENKMLSGEGLLPLPTPNGLLSVAYLTELKMAAPVSFNFTDAWGLAFMAAWNPEPVRKIYPRFRKRLKPTAQGALKLSSYNLNARLEISNEALNTAFALVLCREMGDQVACEGLHRHLSGVYTLQASPENGLHFQNIQPAPYITALVALAEALPETGGGLNRLVSEL